MQKVVVRLLAYAIPGNVGVTRRDAGEREDDCRECEGGGGVKEAVAYIVLQSVGINVHMEDGGTW